MMDPDDFRACLISMGYDLVSARLTLKRAPLVALKQLSLQQQRGCPSVNVLTI